MKLICLCLVVQAKKYTESHEWVELADNGKTG